MNASLAERIINSLYNGRNFTPRQASARFRRPPHSVRARVSELRSEGYGINSRPRPTTDGRRRITYTFATQ